MQRHQFDTIYHEHFSYLSLIAGLRIFARAGLRVFDVELPETHGGSIRFFVCHEQASHLESPNVADVLARERVYGLHDDAIYVAWNEQVKETKRALLELLTALNRFADARKLEEPKKDEAALADFRRGVVALRELGLILGLFREASKLAGGAKDELVAGLVQLLIDLRLEARKAKNYALGDQIRQRLGQLGVTLEDRPGGTGWRLG